MSLFQVTRDIGNITFLIFSKLEFLFFFILDVACFTSFNLLVFTERVAKHHVCDRVREQLEAFTRGRWDVIDRNWLRIFNEPELQVLISGPSDGQIDIEDIKANSRYTGGYTG